MEPEGLTKACQPIVPELKHPDCDAPSSSPHKRIESEFHIKSAQQPAKSLSDGEIKGIARCDGTILSRMEPRRKKKDPS